METKNRLDKGRFIQTTLKSLVGKGGFPDSEFMPWLFSWALGEIGYNPGVVQHPYERSAADEVSGGGMIVSCMVMVAQMTERWTVSGGRGFETRPLPREKNGFGRVAKSSAPDDCKSSGISLAGSNPAPPTSVGIINKKAPTITPGLLERSGGEG